MRYKANLNNRRERQGDDSRYAIYCEIERNFKTKNKAKNNMQIGPKLKFQQYYENYINTNLQGKAPNSSQKIAIAKAFLSEEENEKLRKIYEIEDLLNWLPQEKSQGEDDGR